MIAISLFPLSIHAQALTSPFLGINFQVTAYGENMSSIVLPKINIDSINSTVPSGYISGQLNCTSPSTPTSSNPCDVFSFQNTSGQSGTGNGTRIYLNLQNYLLEANGNATINHQSYFFIDYEFILDDVYNGYVTITDSDNNTRTIYVNGSEFHYQRMQLDITEKAITIDDYELVRSVNGLIWNVPIESFNFVYYFIRNFSLDLSNTTFFNYPLFNIESSDEIVVGTRVSNLNTKYIVIFGINKNVWDLSSMNSYFGSLNNISFEKFERIDVRDSPYGDQFSIVKLTFKNDNTSTSVYRSVVFNQNVTIMPIYNNLDGYQNLSTEFALEYGLTNSLLKNINLLANGNASSSNSSNDLDDTNTQFQTDSNSLISIEDSFNSSMNSNLDNINPTFNMGSSFLASANWVSTQFNRIVNNTPFSSLITFGLTLGLGLLIIGKIRK